MVASPSDYEGTNAEASDSNTKVMLRGRPIKERALEGHFHYAKQEHTEYQALLALILMAGLVFFVFTTFYLSIRYCQKCRGILQDLCPSTKDADHDISDCDDELSVETECQNSHRQMSAVEQQEHQDNMVIATGVPNNAETVIHIGATYYISYVPTGCDAVTISTEKVHCDILQVYEVSDCCGNDSSHDVQKSMPPVPYLIL